MLSTVDRKWVRLDSNAGCRVVRPQAGILQPWRSMLRKAAANVNVQRQIQGGGLRRVEDRVTLRFESFGILEDAELPVAERVREALQGE